MKTRTWLIPAIAGLSLTVALVAVSCTQEKKQKSVGLASALQQTMANLKPSSLLHAKKPNYLIVVDKEHPITDAYADTITLVPITNPKGVTHYLEAETANAFLGLQAQMAKQGIQIELDSGYRSVAEQQRIIDEFTEEFGAAYAAHYAAVPGTSEHHTGLAVDVYVVENGKIIDDNDEMNARDDLFDPIHQCLADYGFIQHYDYETWHFRYVGSPQTAVAIQESGLSFEAYAAIHQE